jgi:hypothetical protein
MGVATNIVSIATFTEVQVACIQSLKPFSTFQAKK